MTAIPSHLEILGTVPHGYNLGTVPHSAGRLLVMNEVLGMNQSV